MKRVGLLLCMALLLVGCGKAEVKETVKDNTQKVSSEDEKKNDKQDDIIAAIESYQFEIEGTYKSYLSDKTEKYLVSAKKIEILDKANQTISVQADIQNEFYKINGKKKIDYTYQKDGGNILISSVQIAPGEELAIEPIVKFDVESFYNQDIVVDYFDSYEETPLKKVGKDLIELELTKENIPEIELDYDGSITGRNEAIQTTFEFDGEVIFKLNNGRMFWNTYKISYEPSKELPIEDWWKISNNANDHHLKEVNTSSENS